jgi:ABC-2 type transport system permease protein
MPAPGFAPGPPDFLAPISAGLWRPTLSLWRREMVRFLRQRNRVVSALLTPILFWLVLGLGLNNTFRAPEIPSPSDTSAILHPTSAIPPSRPQASGYLAYFFPGTIVMILLFTAIFSTISVIEDRREGFLQGVLVAPIPRLAIVLGKVLGGASLAVLQGVLLLAFWPWVGQWPGVGWMALAVAVMFVLAMGLTALGLCLAWPMDSAAVFHAVINLVLLPLWFLCGAVFPLTTAPLALRCLMWINPLTYGQAAFTQALHGGRIDAGVPVPLVTALAMTVAMSAGLIVLAALLVRRPRADGLA